MNYEEIVLDSWEQIHTLEIDFPMEIFRGQGDSSWEISSSLCRLLDDIGLVPETSVSI